MLIKECHASASTASEKAPPDDLTRLSCLRPSATPNPRGLTPILAWSSLTHADQIVVYEDGSPIASGRVDMVGSDGSVLWLQADGPDRRLLFLRRDVTVCKLAAPLRQHP